MSGRLATSNIEPKELMAITRLRNAHGYDSLKKLIDISNREINKRLRHTEGHDHVLDQGAGQVLDELMAVFEKVY